MNTANHRKRLGYWRTSIPTNPLRGSNNHKIEMLQCQQEAITQSFEKIAQKIDNYQIEGTPEGLTATLDYLYEQAEEVNAEMIPLLTDRREQVGESISLYEFQSAVNRLKRKLLNSLCINTPPWETLKTDTEPLSIPDIGRNANVLTSNQTKGQSHLEATVVPRNPSGTVPYKCPNRSGYNAQGRSHNARGRSHNVQGRSQDFELKPTEQAGTKGNAHLEATVVPRISPNGIVPCKYQTDPNTSELQSSETKSEDQVVDPRQPVTKRKRNMPKLRQRNLGKKTSSERTSQNLK